MIIPEYKLVKEYAAKKGIRYESMEELLQKPEIIDLFKERIDTLQQQFAASITHPSISSLNSSR